jgi:hypothetical protein
MRASTGWSFNSTPALASAATNVARFDYSPTTGALRGLLNEPARTNSIRNASAGGAVAGTPGTPPTNWSIGTTTNNVTRTIVGTGTEDGIPYIDIRYFGTPSANDTKAHLFDTPTHAAALSGQVWTASVYMRLVGGSLTNINFQQFVVEQNNVGGQLVFTASVSLPLTGAALKTQQKVLTRTLNNAATAFVTQQVHFHAFSGLAADVTVRIGLPQLVQAPTMGSPIVTTSADVTRAADVLTLAAPDDTYGVTIVRESGSTTVASAVVSGGGGYVVPVDPSPLKQVTLSRVFKGLDLGPGGYTLATMSAYVEGYGAYIGNIFMADWVPIASQDPLAQASTTTINRMATWIPLAIAVPLAIGNSPYWDAHIEARVSVDGSTWKDWFPLKSTVITAQKFEWRMVGSLYDYQTTLRAHEARVVVELPLRNVQGSDAALDGTGHLVVTYASPFVATPTVQLTARQSLAPGGTVVITESDRAHFKLEHRNAAGAATAGGSVDYFVQGYGGHA